MNRYEFMSRLERLLSDITPNERNEALQFYNDYFDDAGAENEQDVIRALGSPEKVAATIKADLAGNEDGEFTENGYRDFQDKGQELVRYGQNEKGQRDSYQGDGNQNGYKEHSYSGSKDERFERANRGKRNITMGQVIFIVVLCIFAAPLLIPVAASVFALFVAFAAVLFALFVAVAAVGAAMIVVGIVLLILGIVKVFAAPFGGLCLAGTGLVCAGIGILFAIISVLVCTTVVPSVLRGVVNICRMPFKKRRGEAV